MGGVLTTNKQLLDFSLNMRYNAFAVLAFIALFLVIGPFLPGVSWFSLGDFTLDMVNFYHTIMIPFAFLLILYASELLELRSFERNIVNISTYPILFLTLIGMIFFYPANTQTADYVIQAIRDLWMVILAILFLLNLLMIPFSSRSKFTRIWGAYLLVLVTTISAGIAAIIGMVYEYGNLFGYSSLGWFNSDVTAWGGLQTFLGNAITSHSHEMLPAVMGGIVGLAAISFGYEKLSPLKRNVVNLGMVIALFGSISMTYLYLISTFGTYVIPAIGSFGTGGMNGLALDDTQTGLIGLGALVSIVGLYFILSSRKADRLFQISEMFTWVVTMAVMIGIGYSIELNETFYGFGSPGSPPNGGAGYLYDMAYTDGHLLFAFFMLPLLAGIILVFMYAVKGQETLKRITVYFMAAGAIIGAFGVVTYVLTLFWYVEATGIALLIVAIILMAISLGRSILSDSYEAGTVKS